MEWSVGKSARTVLGQRGLTQSEIKEQEKEGTGTWATGRKLVKLQRPKRHVLKWLRNLSNVEI